MVLLNYFFNSWNHPNTNLLIKIIKVLPPPLLYEEAHLICLKFSHGGFRTPVKLPENKVQYLLINQWIRTRLIRNFCIIQRQSLVAVSSIIFHNKSIYQAFQEYSLCQNYHLSQKVHKGQAGHNYPQAEVRLDTCKYIVDHQKLYQMAKVFIDLQLIIVRILSVLTGLQMVWITQCLLVDQYLLAFVKVMKENQSNRSHV